MSGIIEWFSRTTKLGTPCIDGGRYHAWKRTSYAGRKTCVWCGLVKVRHWRRR